MESENFFYKSYSVCQTEQLLCTYNIWECPIKVKVMLLFHFFPRKHQGCSFSQNTNYLLSIQQVIVKNINSSAICPGNIWSNFMRTHIGQKNCHFLQSVVGITEGPKNKIMRKSGIHSSVPCQDSTLKQFFFSLVSNFFFKNGVSWGLSFMAEVLFW